MYNYLTKKLKNYGVSIPRSFHPLPVFQFGVLGFHVIQKLLGGSPNKPQMPGGFEVVHPRQPQFAAGADMECECLMQAPELKKPNLIARQHNTFAHLRISLSHHRDNQPSANAKKIFQLNFF
jgi:hypothetical protein